MSFYAKYKNVKKEERGQRKEKMGALGSNKCKTREVVVNKSKQSVFKRIALGGKI
jgi:hypothetical protein